MKIVIDDLNLSILDKTFITEWLTNSKELELELVFKSIFINTGKIRKLVSIICDELWINPIMKFKLVLIVDELNNNAIEYGSLPEDFNIMRLYIREDLDGYYINIEVEDSWKWKEHKKSYEMVKIGEVKLREWFSNNSSIRGRWLFLIIRNIVDELYFNDSHNRWLIVWVKKKIKI